MSLPTVVLAAIAAITTETPASSATAAANGSGPELLTALWAGPNAAPPSVLPASVVAAVYGRYGWTGLYRSPTTDSITIIQTNTPITAASCDRTREPRPTPMAASSAPARTCPAAYLAIVATLIGSK